MAILALYALLLLVALLNLALMRRPRGQGDPTGIVVLIPARNEAENLRELLPLLTPHVAVYVCDDESEDGTGELAAALGARVIRSQEPLPNGWTGKNRACHLLAQAALAETEAKSLLFLDADVRPGPRFIHAMAELAARPGIHVVTGFPKVIPGEGVEPLFLVWVGWILLASNPFGLVSRVGLGHNAFTNGQVHLWRRETYAQMMPNEAVRSRILEDVAIGRLLAKQGRRVEVANLTGHLEIRMYRTWREALDGMSKNSYEITHSALGTVLFALFFLLLAFGWLIGGPHSWIGLLLLTLSGVTVAITVRTPVWPTAFMPLALVIGSMTLIRSLVWRMTGRTTWKGRLYRT